MRVAETGEGSVLSQHVAGPGTADVGGALGTVRRATDILLLFSTR